MELPYSFEYLKAGYENEFNCKLSDNENMTQLFREIADLSAKAYKKGYEQGYNDCLNNYNNT